MEKTPASDGRLLVLIDGARCALPVSAVERVTSLHRSDIAGVPFDTGGRIRGLFPYKGSVVALVRREGLTAASDRAGSEELTAVILRAGGRRFALLVDRAFAVEDAEAGGDSVRLDVDALYRGAEDA